MQALVSAKTEAAADSALSALRGGLAGPVRVREGDGRGGGIFFFLPFLVSFSCIETVTTKTTIKKFKTADRCFNNCFFFFNSLRARAQRIK